MLAAALHEHLTGKDAEWIGTGDFHAVCALAGMDGEAVLDHLHDLRPLPRQAIGRTA